MLHFKMRSIAVFQDDGRRLRPAFHCIGVQMHILLKKTPKRQVLKSPKLQKNL